MGKMNYKIKSLHLFLFAIISVSCQKEFEENVDGRVFVITQGVEMVTEINDKFAIGQGEIRLSGKLLPSDLWLVSKGLIYGTDSSALKIKSYSYDNNNYNSYYACFQPYTYMTISNTASVINIEITGTIWRDNGQIYGYEYWQSGGYGEFSCPLSNLKGATRYYFRSFAHVSNHGTFDKYLYGDIKDFISGGITQDPTVFIPIEALGIGVMKEDLFQTGIGFNANRGCSQFNFDGGIGGYADWQVPTIDQLKEIYKLRTQIGGFKSAWYFSCDEGISPYYHYWDFATNTQGCEQLDGYSSQTGYVRLVRPLP
ncbi:MAG: DUF1566 domain-containing protein [Bacteroidales bacterium]|nr:DUF1566 domain-containing protein [Bacteroidales bacterium]